MNFLGSGCSLAPKILLFALLYFTPYSLQAEIAATHVYHNHMPNFWPYYDVKEYEKIPVGAPIRYAYDGQVIQLKKNPPPNWPRLPNGNPMPHDNLAGGGGYYGHHAKWGAYLYWPWQVTNDFNASFPFSQKHVTMSASVINNVQSLVTGDIPELNGKYNDPAWGAPWQNSYETRRTRHGYRALDMVHFTGHHSMGPLVGAEYFLKDLIYHNVTLAQDYFLGSSFRSSKGFFPTELGFSRRLIPQLKKLGIEWSVIANVHFSRTLHDYPYLNDPGIDTLTSPPNRADLQNNSQVGSWVALNMFNEKQVTHNKFPFASIPHWVEYIDPNTGESLRIAGIPVEQASSWEEGYQGQTRADVLKPFEGDARRLGRKQYFVIAHDGDNSSGRAGSEETWRNGSLVTYSDSGVIGMGVDEYLAANPIPADDLAHVQDGSWIDTRDSSADPSWYHWRMPFGVWKGQLDNFNKATGNQYPLATALDGAAISHMVSLEYGYNYLERNFALLQVALNYAKTAEQIWLDANPNHWQPKTALDKEVTYAGNQLNPWQLSYPVKGDAANNYRGGANPAELAWYFLLPALDSGFGYYDENEDDHVKPTISFNQSLHFSTKYLKSRYRQDRTGPSIWWPQRYPYNPGSVNCSKAEGWSYLWANQEFAIYTYAFDLNGIEDIKVKIRVHRNSFADPMDKTYQVYDPAALAKDPRIDPAQVSAWRAYPMKKRSLTSEMNHVAWQAAMSEVMAIVPAQQIGDLYYTYFDTYQNQLLDYYIEAVDKLGNVSRSDIQQVYVGAGRYTRTATGKLVESVNGEITGQRPFFSDRPTSVAVNVYIKPSAPEVGEMMVRHRLANKDVWSAPLTIKKQPNGYFYLALTYTKDHDGIVLHYQEKGKTGSPLPNGILLTEGTWNIDELGILRKNVPTDIENWVHLYYASGFQDKTHIHYQPQGGEWTPVPGTLMQPAAIQGYYEIEINIGIAEALQAVFTDGKGKWDNNGGRNYLFPIGASYLKDGRIFPGVPTSPVPTSKADSF